MSEQNGSTALVNRQIQKAVERALEDVQQFIDSPRAKEKMQYVLVRQVADNPALQQCRPESFAVAVYEMFKLGLDPRGQNEAWLIPYKGEAKMQTGYAGKRKLALNDFRVDDVFAKAVHQNDTYELDPRTGQPLHTYSPFKPRGAIIGYYGAVRYNNGSWHTEEMDIPTMRTWKNTYSKAAQKAVWAEDRGTDGLRPCSFDGMAIKTMLSRICHTKHMSLSPEAQEALALDDTLYGRIKDVTPDPSTYVPTTEEHAQNVHDVHGERAPTPEHFAPPPQPSVPPLGKNIPAVKLAPDIPDMGKPPAPQEDLARRRAPEDTPQWFREEADQYVNDAADACGAMKADIWSGIKRIAPAGFKLQYKEDLDRVLVLLPLAVQNWQAKQDFDDLVAKDSTGQESQSASEPDDDIAPPLLTLDTWLAETARGKGGTVDDVRAWLKEHDKQDLLGQAVHLDTCAELPLCLDRLDAILKGMPILSTVDATPETQHTPV